MTVVFFGTSGFGLPALEALSKGPHKLLAVVTQPDRPAGRDLKMKASAVKEWALAHAFPVIESSPETDKACFEGLKKLGADVFVVIAFGRLLKKETLSLPKIAAINVHGSLLPRWRGASPMQSAILAGDTKTGVSVMRMVEALDAGDLLLSEEMPLEPRETILTLEPKLSMLGASALMEGLALLASGRASWTPQEPSRVTVCAKIKKEDGRLRWTEPAEMLDRKVRAFVSWPGAFAFAGEKRMLVKKCRVEKTGQGKPGEVLKADADGLWVACSSGTLVIDQLQLEGKKAMPAAEFLKGFPLQPGEFLL